MSDVGDLFSWGSDRLDLNERDATRYSYFMFINCVFLSNFDFRYGQLGHGNSAETMICVSPRKIEALRKVFVVRIAAGTMHSLCATDSNEIYAWVRNAFPI